MNAHPGKGPSVRAAAETGADNTRRRREDLPNTRIMNSSNLRGNPRAKLSLRYGAVHAQALAGKTPTAAQIPTTELRLLVATMVD